MGGLATILVPLAQYGYAIPLLVLSFAIASFTNPVYNAFLAWAGYETEAAEILDAGDVGDWRRVRAALTDELVDEIAVIGTAEQCQERLFTLAEAGIQTPMLFCLSDDPDVQRATYAALSPAAMSAK